MKPLESKVVVVTGAAKRIGRTLALRAARAGATVAIHYNGSEREARATAEACGGASLFPADLTSVPAILRLFEDIHQRLGAIDCLVNNAARFTRFHPLDITEADWDFIHDVNLKATFFCAQQAAKRMKPGGRIVNISSLGGIRPWADHVHYCASKAGVIMLTKALAKALAPDITVNSVAPGVIPFNDLDQAAQRMVENTPAQRAGTPDEIADAVLFFLTTNTFITGQIMAVDGGLSQR